MKDLTNNHEAELNYVSNLGSDIKILANTIDAEESRVAILENEKLRELFIERMWESQKSGEIYKARVESILPGMNAAFVGLGDGRNAFLYLNDAKGVDVKQNAEILVQVTKTARKNKGARVTTRISIPGRYLVLVPGSHDIGVSKRISNEAERTRLREIAKSFDTDGFGIIMRTAVSGMDKEAILEDFESLKALWRQIEKDAKKQHAPCLLYRDLGLTGRILRDELNVSVSEIVVDNEEEYNKVKEYLEHYTSEENRPSLSYYRGNIPIFEYFDIEKDIAAILEQKVWLPSGAYLIIDQTEALTVMDVNTGKFVGNTNLRNTVLATNLEAAEEIARQLRLRAIGGIIIIDFIDMDNDEDKQALLSRLEEVFADDRCKVRIFGVSQLGLVELTRKRARLDIKSILTRPCMCCGAVTSVLKEDSIAMSLKRFLRKVFLSNRGEAVLVEVNAEIAKYISEVYLSAWEEEFSKTIFMKASSTLAWDKFRLELQGSLENVSHRALSGKVREEQVVVYRTIDA